MQLLTVLAIFVAAAAAVPAAAPAPFEVVGPIYLNKRQAEGCYCIDHEWCCPDYCRGEADGYYC